VYSVIATFLLCVSVAVCFVLLALLWGERVVRPQEYEEVFLQGDRSARNKIAVIYLTGIIYDGEMSDDGLAGAIKEQLTQAVEDEHVKAIVLRINSPGGEVVASDAIYRALAEVRDEHHKPIVACMESVAASGAYYAAMGTSYVMATDLTITGSIGVIMQSFGFSGLMDKIGVKSHTFKSGKYKDLLNPTREPTEEEKQMVNTLIMEVYDKFVGIVAKERKLDVHELKNTLADGRILSGQQALAGKLIDGIGDFDDAVHKAMELANIPKAKVVAYSAPFSLKRLFRFLGQSQSAKLHIQLGPTLPRLESGKLYFLPPYMFQ